MSFGTCFLSGFSFFFNFLNVGVSCFFSPFIKGNMEDDLAKLRQSDVEEAFQEDVTTLERDLELSLIGSCITDSVVNFSSLQNIMADLWHPIRGIAISDIGKKRCLFKFFHVVDLNRVLEGMPWFFNKHALMLHQLNLKEDRLTIPLHFVVFWIQIYDLPLSLMSEAMANRFGTFFGELLEYDMRIPTTGFQRFMRIKVKIDALQPLKRLKKLQVGNQNYYARFQYEKLSVFYFICGKLGHGESYCSIRVHTDSVSIVFGWDVSLRAAGRGGPLRVSR